MIQHGNLKFKTFLKFYEIGVFRIVDYKTEKSDL